MLVSWTFSWEYCLSTSPCKKINDKMSFAFVVHNDHFYTFNPLAPSALWTIAQFLVWKWCGMCWLRCSRQCWGEEEHLTVVSAGLCPELSLLESQLCWYLCHQHCLNYMRRWAFIGGLNFSCSCIQSYGLRWSDFLSPSLWFFSVTLPLLKEILAREQVWITAWSSLRQSVSLFLHQSDSLAQLEAVVVAR